MRVGGLSVKKWIVSVSLLFVGQSSLGLTALQADENTMANGKGLVIVTVTPPPTTVNLPDWPIIELDANDSESDSTEAQQTLLFSFGGSPNSLYTLSLQENSDTEDSNIELSTTSPNVGFFDETGVQSFQLQLEVESVDSNTETESQDPVEITVEHN